MTVEIRKFATVALLHMTVPVPMIRAAGMKAAMNDGTKKLCLMD